MHAKVRWDSRHYVCIVQGKFRPRTGHEDPQREWALNGAGDKRHAPADLPPGKEPGTHCIGGWVDPTAGLDG